MEKNEEMKQVIASERLYKLLKLFCRENKDADECEMKEIFDNGGSFKVSFVGNELTSEFIFTYDGVKYMFGFVQDVMDRNKDNIKYYEIE